jgi:prepilin-type N-terminal cleavage/methylation domain-containing protein
MQNNGFTLVELLISLTLTGIITVGLFAVITNYLVLVSRNSILVDMTVDSQNLLRSTVENLRYGAGVRQTNSINDTNMTGGWNTSNTDFVIIIAVPAIDSSGDYIINTSTGSPYNNELVYFKDGNILTRRTLAHPDATGNTLITTCPDSVATASCPSDVKLINHVDDMVFTLYNQDDVPITDPLLARSVKIDLSMARSTFGEPLTLDNSIRVTLRNNF